jgi:hypothetical protein
MPVDDIGELRGPSQQTGFARRASKTGRRRAKSTVLPMMTPSLERSCAAARPQNNAPARQPLFPRRSRNDSFAALATGTLVASISYGLSILSIDTVRRFPISQAARPDLIVHGAGKGLLKRTPTIRSVCHARLTHQERPLFLQWTSKRPGKATAVPNLRRAPVSLMLVITQSTLAPA